MSRMLSGCRGFDPRPCMRGDLRTHAFTARHSGFDPRPCMRGDHRRTEALSPELRFDPRPCMRGDSSSFVPGFIPALFRSAPLHEGRRDDKISAVLVLCFDPRPCMRGDQARPARVASHLGFDPRPCMRGDVDVTQFDWFDDAFRSAPLHEGRRGGDERAVSLVFVSIRAPA